MLDKKIPKLKKKLKSFFTDESGEISSKDILTLGIGAMFVASGIQTTDASYGVPCSGHLSTGGSTHSSRYDPCGHTNVGHASGTTPGHASFLVNGSYSVTPAGAGHASRGAVSFNSGGHGSHGSHGSHAAY